jgi:hypothetical protein
VRRRLHAPVCGVTQVECAGLLPSLEGEPRERVERKDLDRGVVATARTGEDPDESLLRAGQMVLRIQRSEQAVAQRRLFATSGTAVPCGRRF